MGARVVELVVDRPFAAPPRARALERLVDRLERWLPREEERLTRLREEGRPDLVSEAEWQVSLRAYERLSAALRELEAAA